MDRLRIFFSMTGKGEGDRGGFEGKDSGEEGDTLKGTSEKDIRESKDEIAGEVIRQIQVIEKEGCVNLKGDKYP